MRTAGIIGGLGPETTAEFYLELVRGCHHKDNLSRPPVLIWSVPQKYEIERDLVMRASGEERYIPYLVEAVERLEKGGAEFLVMPCNSLHAFIDEIRRAAKVPVLNIIDETSAFLSSKGVRKAGILATSTTIGRGLYGKALGREGIAQLVPDPDDQSALLGVIDHILMNRHTDADRRQLLTVIDRLASRGAEDVILACTDLQILKPRHDRIRIYDTMKILADSTVENILNGSRIGLG